METDQTKGATQLVVSRAHLESVRRSARGIKFKLDCSTWDVKLNLDLGTPKISFPIDEAGMIGIIKLLAAPVHLKFGYERSGYKGVDWTELYQIAKYVNGLTVYHQFDSPEFFGFISSLSSHLKVLTSSWSVLARFPPLDLERARLYHPPNDFSELNRHKIHRLDVPAFVISYLSELQGNQVISSAIKSLGILHIRYWPDFPCYSIEVFCRRFPSLEDLHIICENEEDVEDVSVYFTELWAGCLEIRDRLHVAGLKRLFITIKHDCDFLASEIDGFEKLKQVEAFDKASSTIDRSNECVRMFLKHNAPRGPKPTFLLIKGEFHWSMQEDEETNEHLFDDQMEDEAENETMEEDEELDGSSEDAMDKSESTDEDGMDDAGVY
ncbi:hypothetical protein M3Y99_01048200 [Aphelenchoides fujianensis]|nr:hypothetical protein M3Y99_01048200 [Aphelenchoides fujianensis]